MSVASVRVRLLILVGMFAALFGGTLILFPLLPLSEGLPTLIFVMSVIAVFSILSGYVAYRFRLLRWLSSLRWALALTLILTVLLIFLNVWVTAQLMFINPYDLMVTGVLFLFAGLIALIFGLFVSRSITDSIRELMMAAESLARGKLDTRLHIDGNDELAEFAKTFNWMAMRLQEVDEQKSQLDQQRRDLIAWASHDLRTPLTSLRVMVEALNDGVVSDTATMTRYLTNMNAEIKNLSSLIDNLFELAQLDAGHIRLDYQMASLRDLISDTLGVMTARAEQNGIGLVGEVDPAVDPIEMATDKMQRVLYNLLDNAIRYTPTGGSVTLRAVPDGDEVRVSVENCGDGMEALDLSQVFTRFYRQERSRAQSKDGRRSAGLGLAITRGFVEAHGGRIGVESAPGTVKFSFTIPRRRA